MLFLRSGRSKGKACTHSVTTYAWWNDFNHSCFCTVENEIKKHLIKTNNLSEQPFFSRCPVTAQQWQSSQGRSSTVSINVSDIKCVLLYGDWVTTMILWQSKPFVLLRAVCCSSLSPNNIYNKRHGWFFLKGLNWNLWCRGHMKLTGRQSAKKRNSAAAGMSDLVEAWFVKQVKPEILSSP